MFRGSGFAVALALSATGASAADFFRPAPGSNFFTPAPAVSWTGFYVGVTGGYATGQFDFNQATIRVPGFGSFTGDLATEADADGLIGGVTLGYNYVISNVLFGFEADASFVNLKHSEEFTFSDFLFLGDHLAFTDEAELRWLSTVRGRLGYVMDRVTIFGTGGLAVASGKGETGFFYEDGAGFVASGSSSDENTHVGWALGGGIEAMLAPSVTAKAEYLFIDLEDESYSFKLAGIGADVEAGGQFHVIRVGINYLFNQPPTPAPVF